MQRKTFIMIGAPIISRDVFRTILRPLNNYSFKPEGGFWASEYQNNIYNISNWLTYLTYEARSIATYKDINNSVIFSLKEDSKILTINNFNLILELATIYPSTHQQLGYFSEITPYNTIFDFEKLKDDYDGIYIDCSYFNNQFETTVFDTVKVSSLLLFNLDCIKEYKSSPIIFDINDPSSIPYIQDIGKSMTIEDETEEHMLLSKISKEIFLEKIKYYNDYNFDDYDEYLCIITQNIMTLIKILENNYSELVEKIIKKLESKGMYRSKNIIIQNIILNYLSEYLKQDEKRIKTLSKTKIKTPKTYKIY